MKHVGILGNNYDGCDYINSSSIGVHVDLPWKTEQSMAKETRSMARMLVNQRISGQLYLLPIGMKIYLYNTILRRFLKNLCLTGKWILLRVGFKVKPTIVNIGTT